MRNPDLLKLKVIDSHAGGEPTRVITEVPESIADMDTGNLKDRRDLMAANYDWIRTTCLLEPRGHEAMVGALLCKPVNPDCVTGVIFFNNVGYLNSCIHGTICVAVTLAHMGVLTEGKHLIETPIGEVIAELHSDGHVTVANVPSYRYKKDVSVHVDGYGEVIGDIAWGGNWFFLVNGHGPAVVQENIPQLTQFASQVAQALAKQGVTGEQDMVIDHIEVFGAPTPRVSDSRSFVLCPGLQYDRSPCGTGTSAKLACLYADGKLKPGDTWRQASILDTVFEGRIEALASNQVTPYISGSAYVNGEATLLIHEQDPFKHGITNT